MIKNVIKNAAGREEGSVTVMGAFGLILLLMFMAVMVDMGLYYIESKKLQAAADYMDDEVSQMLPYYSYADNYQEIMDSEFRANIKEFGYSDDNIDKLHVKRTYDSNTGNPVITVELSISLKDTYHCIFLPVVGISDLKVHVANSYVKNYNVDKIYKKGMPYTDWKGGVKLPD